AVGNGATNRYLNSRKLLCPSSQARAPAMPVTTTFLGELQRGDGCGIVSAFNVARGGALAEPSVVNAVKCAVASNPLTGGPNMRDSKLSRRDMLRASTALAAGAVFAEPLTAAAPAPTPMSPAMIQAARSPPHPLSYLWNDAAEGAIDGQVRRSTQMTP